MECTKLQEIREEEGKRRSRRVHEHAGTHTFCVDFILCPCGPLQLGWGLTPSASTPAAHLEHLSTFHRKGRGEHFAPFSEPVSRYPKRPPPSQMVSSGLESRLRWPIPLPINDFSGRTLSWRRPRRRPQDASLCKRTDSFLDKKGSQASWNISVDSQVPQRPSGCLFHPVLHPPRRLWRSAAGSGAVTRCGLESRRLGHAEASCQPRASPQAPS
jgi:hypothetical protein